MPRARAAPAGHAAAKPSVREHFVLRAPVAGRIAGPAVENDAYAAASAGRFIPVAIIHPSPIGSAAGIVFPRTALQNESRQRPVARPRAHNRSWS